MKAKTKRRLKDIEKAIKGLDKRIKAVEKIAQGGWTKMRDEEQGERMSRGKKK